MLPTKRVEGMEVTAPAMGWAGRTTRTTEHRCLCQRWYYHCRLTSCHWKQRCFQGTLRPTGGPGGVGSEVVWGPLGRADQTQRWVLVVAVVQ